MRQVDISKKDIVYREASAIGRIRLSRATVNLVRTGKLEKGDPISIAETMAIMGAKLTPRVVALCHQLNIEKVEPKVTMGADWIEVAVTVGANGKTGVEMEALTAVSTALLNIWDVVKAHEKDPDGQYPTTLIESVRVSRKVKRKS
ncbi:MAG TPA: cyclic pyranopterin monophosphate synthase MoaC [Nitrososphaerales archaeon]|nr:cyclic pyranopterin monophosphate synthase MoaC [Nitrososphaerales archaeon]